jgi:predicted phosphodiesterase
MPTRAAPDLQLKRKGSASNAAPATRLLVVSDVHFHDPLYQQHMVNGGRAVSDPPSRLSTQTALGDPQNPFHGLLRLVAEGQVKADALVCCGDLTTCADPTAMNLGWLQLHRLSEALKAGEPIVTAGNHDIDSRFKLSTTSPMRMLRYLDPPFPTANRRAATSYWSNGYCIIERRPHLRVVVVNTCSLHGYQTEQDRQSDHGIFPEQLLQDLPEALSDWNAPLNVLLCHHHPKEIDLPAEDKSVAINGEQLLDKLSQIGQPNWLVLHGHRHLPAVKYASSSGTAPVIFSAGSFSANLHLRIQGRTQNQFYVLDLENQGNELRGRYEAWTWSAHEGEWRRGEATPALPAFGGFGFRPNPAHAARTIAALVPARTAGSITWLQIEEQVPDFRFLLPEERVAVLDILHTDHGIEWETQSMRPGVDSAYLRLGRTA